MATNAKLPAQRVSGKRQSASVTHVTAGMLDARLLDAITEHIADRYSGLSDDDYLILAIWIVHTYFYLSLGITPYLHIASLGPDAGKSELAAILADLSYEAKRIVPTVATLGQFSASDKHVIIIDEFDSLIASRNTDLSGLWMLLNLGYKPGTPWQVSGQPERDMFFPKVMVGIGPGILRDTVAGRSIRVMAVPGSEADQRERNRRQSLRPVADSVSALRARLGRVAKPAVRTAIAAAMLPSCERTQLLNDGAMIINRDQEIWRVMITIADLFGTDCGKRMRDIVASRISTEPEYLPNAAEIIDAKLRTLMREGKLTAINWLDGKEPLQRQTGYPLTDADFGYPAPRNGQRGKLPSASLYRKASEKTAQLFFPAKDFPEICAALNMRATDVKRAYADAGRLRAQAGRTNISLPFKEGQAKISIVAIDVSCWLWPASDTTEA